MRLASNTYRTVAPFCGKGGRGFWGLRVLDASIMPNCVRVNIIVTTMMVGERVADMIRGED